MVHGKADVKTDAETPKRRKGGSVLGRLFSLVLLVFILGAGAVVLSGCAQKSAPVPPAAETGEGAAAGGKGGTETQPIPPAETPEKLTLYFGDRQAMYLIPEVREVALNGRSKEEAVVQELIKGPQSPQLAKTIPEGTRLLSVRVEKGVAYVDFSREFQTRHWGGSAGEAMTLYSVINSLAKLPGIEKVQFLLEGKKQESILGHADTTQPLAPNWQLVKEK